MLQCYHRNWKKQVVTMENVTMFENELLTQEELAIVKGGLMEASSTQMESCEMGKSSCCNIHIDF